MLTGYSRGTHRVLVRTARSCLDILPSEKFSYGATKAEPVDAYEKPLQPAREWAHPARICAGTAWARPRPHLRRD